MKKADPLGVDLSVSEKPFLPADATFQNPKKF